MQNDNRTTLSNMLSDEDNKNETNPLLEKVQRRPMEPQPLILSSRVIPQHGEEVAEAQEEYSRLLKYYIKGIVDCIRKMFARMPLFARILLFASLIYCFSTIVNMLIPLIAPPMNCISTFLTIITSAIFFYQIVRKSKR